MALALLFPGCSSPGSPTSDGGGAAATAEERIVVIDTPSIGVTTVDGVLQRLEPGEYIRPVAEGSTAALLLEGLKGVVVDLTGVELRGQQADEDIDGASGVGILVRGCTDVTIRGGTLGGYRGCIVVEDSERVTIQRVRFDGWYGKRLRSTAYSEDLTDWLRPHENDGGEWLANYGAAVSVTDGTEVVIEGCRGRRGQNGILLTRTRQSRVYDNDFSFLSGWGLGMFRACDNVVSHNIFDYCVRGYSHDVYWRGQDSAGILMFEGCCRNIVAENSATHGGDGVFLYGGNDLVERGQREASGSDENIFYGNDLRFAVANSLEATFSHGNVVVQNNLSGSHQHGIWGGYSTGMVILDNAIDETIGGGITVEHGTGCVIADNHFGGNEIGLELYWDEDPQFVDGAYGRIRSTKSADHAIVGNTFADNVLDLVLSRTTGLVFHANRYLPGTREPYFERVSASTDPSLDKGTVQRWLDSLEGTFPSGNLQDVTLVPWKGEAPELLTEWRAWSPPSYPGTMEIDAEKRDEFRGGLETIVMGEWGPWDFRSGAPRPEQKKPGGLLEDARWQAAWFRWDPATSDPRTDEAAWRAAAGSPLVQRTVDTFGNPWASNDIRRVVGNDYFGLFARTQFDLPRSGTFDLTVDSDDGVRVFVDGELVVEDWTWHGTKRETVGIILDAGEHTILVEYFQIQGGASLLVSLDPASR